MRILVTGSSGFIGNNIKDIIGQSSNDFIFVTSKDYNLELQDEFYSMINDIKPNKIIHLAAYSGGIKANRDFPADFYHRNLYMINNLFLALLKSKHKVEKTLITIGGCSYPDTSDILFEDNIWNGFPQIDSAPYSLAKKTAIIASYAFKKQYNINSQVVIPANVYGKYDNFDLDTSHVIPALVKKFIDNKNIIKIWGDGNPVRDFIYSEDLAKILIKIIYNDYNFDLLNISSGKGVSIKNVVKSLIQITNYNGKIEYDKSKPSGQSVKIFSNKQMLKLDLKLETDLFEGLKKTVIWFQKNYS